MPRLSIPRRRTFAIVCSAVLSIAAISSSSFALQPAEAPASAPTTSGTVEALQVTVTGVEGIVQVRSAEDQPWQKATVGMVLDQNAEFRTSVRSAVRFTIPPDQTITLDRLGVVKVVQAVNDSGKLKTKIGMKYGRTRYDIESAGQEHEASISSPSSTLAIRGTKVSVYDQRPFTVEAVSLTGRAEFQDAKKHVFLGKKGEGKQKVDGNSSSAAGYALASTVVDPSIAKARTASESGLIAALYSTGSTFSYDFEKGIKVVRGGRPLTDTELLPTLPGVLNFVLRWTANADLNIGVISPGTGPGNHTVYPIAGYDNANGGHIEFDHRGGAHGGMEIVSFPATFPEGIYRIGAVHISGVNTPATVEVFLNGKPVTINTGQGPTKTASFIGEPINPAFGAGIAVGDVRLFPSQGQIGTAAPSAVKVARRK